MQRLLSFFCGISDTVRHPYFREKILQYMAHWRILGYLQKVMYQKGSWCSSFKWSFLVTKSTSMCQMQKNSSLVKFWLVFFSPTPVWSFFIYFQPIWFSYPYHSHSFYLFEEVCKGIVAQVDAWGVPYGSLFACLTGYVSKTSCTYICSNVVIRNVFLTVKLHAIRNFSQHLH